MPQTNGSSGKTFRLVSLAITLFGILLTATVALMQWQLSREWNMIKQALRQDELKVSRSECAASLIPVLISGDACEKRTAMVILKNLDDTTLSANLFNAIASDACTPENIRMEAVKGMKRTAAGGEALATVQQLRDEATNPYDRIEATVAEQAILHRTVATAYAAFDKKDMKHAAHAFAEAAAVLSTDRLHTDSLATTTLLASADSCLNAEEYHTAAHEYKRMFDALKMQ
jgi:hypothetical protein